ncbi:hypothetical protein [Rhodococcus gannanensis]|uniref:Uncharacterized protein n=1 Tax=Rhodococcus gannanensis TaxID=1960308 RepID=A0ABW4P4T0_9NOCA
MTGNPVTTDGDDLPQPERLHLMVKGTETLQVRDDCPATGARIANVELDDVVELALLSGPATTGEPAVPIPGAHERHGFRIGPVRQRPGWRGVQSAVPVSVDTVGETRVRAHGCENCVSHRPDTRRHDPRTVELRNRQRVKAAWS